ncbi:MAG: TetR/AcrR family transcriptional regulator [Hyphomicrobium sp.]|nr:TetR/AcrR family transcriptional regulator [Hyphomicrobium sp.]
MGRRSIHTADELRALILEASTALISEQGLAGLSAREIARRIGYSPGTLYNVFDNLDELVLTIEGQMLDQLSAVLDTVASGRSHETFVLEFARAYVRFTREHPKLWNLLFEHHLPADRTVPVWYQQKLDGLMSRLADALQPAMSGASPDEIRRAASVLWAGVHGLTSLATADKLSAVTNESVGPLVDDLVGTYLSGVKSRYNARSTSS